MVLKIRHNGEFMIADIGSCALAGRYTISSGSLNFPVMPYGKFFFLVFFFSLNQNI
jgi:hypothetical protein